MEAILLGSLPAVTVSTKQPFAISGTLPDGYTLHGLLLSANLGLKNTAAATFTVAGADLNTIANALFTRTRLRAWGEDDVYNLNPIEGRTLAFYANGQDPFEVDQRLRTGGTLPATATGLLTCALNWPIWFTHRNLEWPEIFAPSTDQFNVDGHKLVVELGAGVASLVLTNATLSANSTMTGLDVYGIISPNDVVHFGPKHYMKQLSVAQTRFPEDGKAIDMLLADERDPYTVAAQVSQYSVTRDGNRTSPGNITPPVLAQRFLESGDNCDGARPIDLTSNTKGLTGSQITPIIYLDGQIRSSEWQMPVFRKNRTVFQNLASGGSPSATWLNWQIRAMEDSYKEFKKLLGRTQFATSSLDDLEVRGGGGKDQYILQDFKGRQLAPRKKMKAA